MGWYKCSLLYLCGAFLLSTYNFLYNYTSWFCFITFLFITHIFKQSIVVLPLYDTTIFTLITFFTIISNIVTVSFHRYASFFIFKHPAFCTEHLAENFRLISIFRIFFNILISFLISDTLCIFISFYDTFRIFLNIT